MLVDTCTVSAFPILGSGSTRNLEVSRPYKERLQVGRSLNVVLVPMLERWIPLMVRFTRNFHAFRQPRSHLHAASGLTFARYLRHLTAIGVLVQLTLLLTTSGTVTAHAAGVASDPLVLIAVDATSPSCTYSRTAGNHTHSSDYTAAERHTSTKWCIRQIHATAGI
jgi:hypothetical protein